MHPRHHQNLVGGFGKQVARIVVVARTLLLQRHQIVDEVQAVARAMVDLAHHHVLGGKLAFFFQQPVIALPDHAIDRFRRHHDQQCDEARRDEQRRQQQLERKVGPFGTALQQNVLELAHLADQE